MADYPALLGELFGTRPRIFVFASVAEAFPLDANEEAEAARGTRTMHDAIRLLPVLLLTGGVTSADRAGRHSLLRAAA